MNESPLVTALIILASILGLALLVGLVCFGIWSLFFGNDPAAWEAWKAATREAEERAREHRATRKATRRG